MINLNDFKVKKKPQIKEEDEENDSLEVEEKKKDNEPKKKNRNEDPEPETKTTKEKKKPESPSDIEKKPKRPSKKENKRNQEDSENEENEKLEQNKKQKRSAQKENKQKPEDSENEENNAFDEGPLKLYSDYYNLKTGELKPPLLKIIESTDEAVRNELLLAFKQKKNARKKDLTQALPPFDHLKFFNSINSHWKELFRNHTNLAEPEEKNLKESVMAVCEDRDKPAFADEVKPIFEYLNKEEEDEEKEEEDEEEDEEREKMEKRDKKLEQTLAKKMMAIRFYNQKLDDQNSFYRTVAFAFLEQLVSESKPFKQLYSFITELKSRQDRETLIPISPKFSINPALQCNFKGWVSYLIDRLMNLANSLWTAVEVNGPEADQTQCFRDLESLFAKDIAFQVGLAMILRQQGYEYLKNRNESEGYQDVKQKLCDVDSLPNEKVYKVISRVLKVKLQVFDLKNSENNFDFEPQSTELSAIILLKEGDYYHLLYDKKQGRRLFPKVFQINEELNSICCDCSKKEGQTFGKCSHKYCPKCLENLLKSNKSAVLKCPRCDQTMGNQSHLLMNSEIKFGRKSEKKKK